MRSKHVWTAVVTTLILSMVFAFQPSETLAAEKTWVLKYSDPSPAGTTRTKGYSEWGEWIEKRTNGRVKVEFYWSQSLAKARDNLPAARGGICDMGYNASFVYHPSIFVVSQFAELLFMGMDWDAHAKAVTEMFRTVPALQKEEERAGAVMISANAGHPTHWMSKKPIRKLEDFKGLRIRALGPMADFVKEAGGTAVPLTVYETYEGLQKGTVDASQAYMYYNIPSKFHEVTQYGIIPGMQFITTQVWMNKALFDSFPDDIKKMFMEEAGIKLQDLISKRMDTSWDESMAALKKAGIEFIEIPPDEFKRWKALGIKVSHEKWLEKCKKKGVDGNEIMRIYEETYKKYERNR